MARSLRTLAAEAVVAALFCAFAQQCPAAPGDAAVRAALGSVERFLDDEPQGATWRAYLQIDRLKEELSRGAPPASGDVRAILARFESDAPGLNRAEFASLREAVRVWEARLAGPSPLAETARAAADRYRPVTVEDLAAARQGLLNAIQNLEARLARDGENGAAWRKYLQIDGLVAAIGAEKADLEALEEFQDRYLADHDGLELVWFREVHDALRRYVQVARTIETPEMPTHYHDFMLQLADALDQYANQPTEELSAAIHGGLIWLEDAGQAPELVAAIRDTYQKSNVHAVLSEEFVAAGLEGPVDRVEDVRDCILGTSVFGTGKVDGWIDAQLVPSADVATIELAIQSTTISHTVGYNGPVRVYSRGQTQIHVTKRLQVDADGLTPLSAVSEARTRATTLDIQTKRGSRLVEWLAWRRSRKLQGQANAIAGQHAEVKANTRADDEAGQQAAETNERYEEKLRTPLRLRRVFPRELAIRSTDSTMEIDGLEARGVQLASAFPPPAVTAERPDMAIRIHESLIHNLTSDLLAGRTVRIEDLQQLAMDTLGKVPPALEPDEDREPWGITFAMQRPVSVSFDDGLFRLLLRVDRFYQGDEPVQGMNVQVTYRPQPTANGFEATREGEIEVYHPDFPPGSGRRNPPRLQAIRRVMIRRFSKLFPPKIEMAGFTPPGKWEDFGRLQPVQITADDQWAVLAWRKAQ